jgi:hypothetical protein
MLHRHAPFHSALTLLTAAALVVTMSACDAVGTFADQGEDAPDVELGRFEMVLSGAMQDTLSGTAVFSTTTEAVSDTSEVTLFGLALIPDSAATAAETRSGFSAQVLRASDRPEEGEYTFAEIEANNLPEDISAFPEESFLFGFVTSTQEQVAYMTSEGGTLEITNSASATLSGRFTVDASGMYYEPGMTDEMPDASITVKGEFRALGGELPDGTL